MNEISHSLKRKIERAETKLQFDNWLNLNQKFLMPKIMQKIKKTKNAKSMQIQRSRTMGMWNIYIRQTENAVDNYLYYPFGILILQILHHLCVFFLFVSNFNSHQINGFSWSMKMSVQFGTIIYLTLLEVVITTQLKACLLFSFSFSAEIKRPNDIVVQFVRKWWFVNVTHILNFINIVEKDDAENDLSCCGFVLEKK